VCQLQNKEDFRKHFDVSRETIAMLDNYDAIIREFGSNTNIISHKSKMTTRIRILPSSSFCVPSKKTLIGFILLNIKFNINIPSCLTL